MQSYYLKYVLLFLTFALTACHHNSVSMVDAGEKQTVNENTAVALQALVSDGGSIRSIEWRQTAGEEVTLKGAETLIPSFTSPVVTSPKTLTFAITITDNAGYEANDSVEIVVNPVITGLVIDDPVANAKVQLVSIPDQEVIFETSTDEFGRYTIPRSELIPKRYSIVISEGTINGKAFLGKMEAVCLNNERVACNVTPISTLIKSYAIAEDELESGDKEVWIATLSEKLGTDLTTDPFIEDADSELAASIRIAIDEGASIDEWQASVLDYLQGEESTEIIDTGFPGVNIDPIADAGSDQSVNEQAKATLDGSASSDSDGTVVSYSWTQTGGTSVSLTGAATASPSFTSPTLTVAESLTFTLTVTDNEGGSHSDSVTVTVSPVNAAPTADAGSDQSVNEQTAVILTGSGSDSDGTVVSYSWTQTGGTSVSLTGAATASPSFTSPTLTVAESLTFTLTVTDNEGGSHSDSVTVTVSPVNAAPTADAGSDQSVNEQTEVILTGSGRDGDGTVASYSWEQTGGSNVSLTDAAIASPSFTAPSLTVAESFTFTLTVTDNEGGSHSDSVKITVNPVNAAPTADAGIDQWANSGAEVTLTGSGSDSDGSIASYSWAQTSGTDVTLNNGSSASASFTATGVSEGETLTFTLTVTDNEGATAADSVNVKINSTPMANAGSDQSVEINSPVTLDGSASSDDGSIVSYSWTQTDGTAVSLTDSDTAAASFTLPLIVSDEALTFKLTVTDDQGLTATDNLVITVNAISAKLNDTGITSCSDASSGLVCPVDGFAGQDAEHGRDVSHNNNSNGHAGFNFSKLDAEGHTLAASATEWSCVQDNVTGLIWEVKTDDDGLRDKDNTYTWYNSDNTTNGGNAGTANDGTCSDTGNCDTEKYAADVNTQKLCGKGDWRLPSREELRSIVNYSTFNPAIDKNYFPNTQSSYYWSSSPYASYGSSAWYVYFSYGGGNSASKSYYLYVRLVRGGQ